MIVSLVITTFNWKEALELSIRSVLSQTHPPNEIIIADDGSSDGTRDIIATIASETDIRISHSWQEDNGFRAAKSRNKAIALAKGDYIILIDGDILVEKHFVKDHLSAAKRGRFVQGSRVIINENKTKEILRRKQLNIAISDSGIENRKNCLRVKLLNNIFSRNKLGLGGIKTCNFAFWRQDAININGFNEDFVGWGREDSDFAVRLMNNGIKRYNIRFMAVAFHMYHNEYLRKRLSVNDALLKKAIAEKLIRCNNGISKYL